MNDLVNALVRHVQDELRHQDAEYVKGALKILDARNCLLRTLPQQPTDEAEDIFALSDLVRTDPDTMLAEPNEARIRQIAKNYF